MALPSNHGSIESLWMTILPKSAASEYQSDDTEIVKLNLLMKATHDLVIDIRQSQLSASHKLRCVTDELRRATEKTEHSEAEVLVLQNHIVSLKHEVKVAECKAKTFQREAQLATTKFERIQTSISARVDKKIRTMFDNFLQQNKNGTALAMMTQVYPETQQPEPEAELLKHSGPSSTKVPKTKQHSKYSEASSPEVIPSTPEVCKSVLNAFKSKVVEDKSCQPSMCKEELPPPSSVPSSPDLINSTPSPVNNFQRKDNKKRRDAFFKLYNKDPAGNSYDEVIHAKDTQDQMSTRLVLADKTVVPGTFDDPNQDMNVDDSANIEIKGGNEGFDYEKENCNHSSFGTNNHFKKMEETEKLPSTPKKDLKAREKSPILGNSGSKKTSNFSKNFGAGHSFSVSVPPNHQSWPQARQINEDVSKVTPSKSGKKFKKQIQQSIEASFNKANKTNKSKLSLSGKSRRTDISKKPEFNGGQRSGKDFSINASHQNVNEEQRSTLNSVGEISDDSLLEDSDVTMFEPTCSVATKVQEAVKRDAFDVSERRSFKALQKTNGELQASLLKPMFVSTITDEAISNKRKSPTLSQVDHGIGKPLMSSTEKPMAGNSEFLNELLEVLNEDEKPIQDTMPYPPETSYDHLPKVSNSPDYAYAGAAVRGKNQRRKLPPALCKTCGEFYDLVFGDDQAAKKAALQECTRCRSRYARRNTPPALWNPLCETLKEDSPPQQQQLSP